MASLNKVLIIGNCTRNPELRYTPRQTAVVEIGVAVNRVYSGEDGEKKEETTFIDVTFWSKLAEIAAKYLTKGSPIFLEGRLQMDSWTDKASGQKRSRLRVVAENMQMLGSRQQSGAASPGMARSPAGTPVSRAPVGTGGFDLDDIPYSCHRG